MNLTRTLLLLLVSICLALVFGDDALEDSSATNAEVITTSVAAAGIAGRTIPIQGKATIPDGSGAGNFKVSLNGVEFVTMTNLDGSFLFPAVPTGIYLVEVEAIHHMFPQAKLRVFAENASVSVVEYRYHGARRIPSTYPLNLVALMPKHYFQPKPQLSLISMLMGNPMMIIMIVSLGIVFVFPYLLQDMSPEELEKLQKGSALPADAADPMKSFQKLMGINKPTEDDD